MKVDDDLVRQVIRPRLRESHKGSYGRVLLVGGLYPYGGAIIMAAIACVNSGAGLVTVATDRENIIALHAHLPEAMAFGKEESEQLAKVSPYTHSPSKGMGKTVWFSYFRAVGFQYSKSLRGVPKWNNSSCQEP